ncbi:MAG TPA: peptidylprolyl isomerase [Bacteroidales bacterium]|nr:peptidylprolyl isomerase [Bacteroidales bacterium]
MAVISKIRSYSGLLIAVVGIALIAFVLGDFFGHGPMRAPTFKVGQIGRTEIPFQEFEQRVNDQIEGWKMQTGMQTVGVNEAFHIRQQVWNTMVREILLGREIDNLGLEISSEELFYFIQGPNPHPIILRNFMNPADGSFNPSLVLNFLNNFERLDASTQQQWVMLEDFIKRDRKETKYHQLIQSGFYMPGVLLSREYQNRHAIANIRYILKPYESIDESQIEVSESEMRAMYKKKRHLHKREASVNLQYVVFPVFASEEDRQEIEKEILQLKEELQTATDIPAFINANSDERFNPAFIGTGELMPDLEQILFNAPVGTVIGPVEDNNAFVVTMLVDVQFRPDSLRASHILIAHERAQGAEGTSRTLDQARLLADSLLNVARRNPVAFGQLASMFSDDPTAQANQGNLDWFRSEEMVPEFAEAVMNAPLNNFTTAETAFGVHVIHVTGKSPLTKKIQVGRLTRIIEPSTRSFQSAFAEASEFANIVRNNKEFEAAADEKGLSLRVAENILEMDVSLPGIETPREIIRWAFAEETRVGSHSSIFDIENRFIIAYVTQKREEGIPEFEEIREEMRTEAIREKKFANLSAVLQEAKSGGSFDQIAETLQLEPVQVNELRFAMLNLPGMGAEPMLVGAAFGLEPNTISEPIKGNAGVFLLEVTGRELAVEPDEFTTLSNQLRGAFVNRMLNETFNALKESSRITDNRVLFY